MRLDHFLSVSRLVKRRPEAKALAEKGGVRLNGEAAKPGRAVHEGDELLLRLGRRELRVRVREVPARRPLRKEAAALYEILSDLRREAEAPGFEEEFDFLRRP